jgi:hypothetical protein
LKIRNLKSMKACSLRSASPQLTGDAGVLAPVPLPTLALGLVLFLLSSAYVSSAAQPPLDLVSRSGNQSIVLHWERCSDPAVNGYNVYRSDSPIGPFVLLNGAGLVMNPGFCDVSGDVVNGRTNFYRVTAVSTGPKESQPSVVLPVASRDFADDNAFLEYLQEVHFDYFWYLANAKNGLVPDRTAPGSACSIAAVGFGLSAIPIGIDHGWITREQGAARVATTLKTFLEGPQGTGKTGNIGYKGWFYHFINMNTGTRTVGELSSIDTVLLVAGIIDVKQYFDGPGTKETAIRRSADAIINRLDWKWMSRGSSLVSMGWFPEAGFIANNWVGYNEAMILYCLGMGATSNALPSSAWTSWTSGYKWATHYGLSFVPFPVLFGHQYSHCWVDFRNINDRVMNGHGLTYFENSRRATLAQRSYCIENPRKHTGYNGLVWGLTACDGPPGYSAHGAPPPQEDDGTIAPTAAGGSIAFTPEISVPTLRYFYDKFRTSLWTAFGFRDAFNLEAHWFAADELGIDQGPIVIMIENYRSQRVWRRFMQNDIVQRGLQRAGFVAKPSVIADRPTRDDSPVRSR